jgi:hypothetical protein
MKKALTVVLCVSVIIAIFGCKRINVGGSGQIGTVTGHGGISIPVPRQAE